MSFVIDDTGLPCTAAGVGGVFVPESISITDICQDPDNLNIIYIKVGIQGVYSYTPTLTIKWEDKEHVFDSHYIPSWNGESVESFPINTMCSSKTVTLAYDIGSSIDNFNTLSEFTVCLKFNGSSEDIFENQIISDTFQSSNPEVEYQFYKGLSPVPYKLFYDESTGKIKVQYIDMGDTPCLCSINCVKPTSDDYNLTTCSDEIQEVTIDSNSIVGDPSNATITFIDSIGNITNIDINAMLNVKPAKMTALKLETPNRVNATFVHTSIYGASINKEKVSYQVLRYKNNSDSIKILKDWSSDGTDSFIDTDVLPGNTYGYSVRFKGEFGDVSRTSQWATVLI